MEEKKKKAVMEAAQSSSAQNAQKAENSQMEKPSYEQLEQLAQNLNQQNRQLYQKLMEADRLLGNFNDIRFLLSILDKSEFFDDDFISRVSSKIQDTVAGMLDSSEKPEEE